MTLIASFGAGVAALFGAFNCLKRTDQSSNLVTMDRDQQRMTQYLMALALAQG